MDTRIPRHLFEPEYYDIEFEGLNKDKLWKKVVTLLYDLQVDLEMQPDFMIPSVWLFY